MLFVAGGEVTLTSVAFALFNLPAGGGGVLALAIGAGGGDCFCVAATGGGGTLLFALGAGGRG